MRRLSAIFLLVLAACTGNGTAPSAPPARSAQTAMPPAGESRGPGLSAWIQLGPNGAAELRATTGEDHCPDAAVDGTALPMNLRAAATPEFRLTCAARLPAAARSVSIEGRDLRMAPSRPERILVLGDTGCRLKGKVAQACNEPAAWPFPRLAAAAAALRPDLVIHVGDYLYRENACPAADAGCAGTPFGDNWPTWNADFFAPAAPLLAAAPWVFVRGNHEDCRRAGFGWTRMLAPAPYDPATPCVDHAPPFEVPFDTLELVVMDDANAPDTAVDASMVPVYRSELAALAGRPAPSWLLLHRPIWAAIAGPLGIPVGGNATLIGAAGTAGIPAPVALMLSGHIHSFEALNYDGPAPPQIVAGNGGDKLDATPGDLRGAIFQGRSGVSVKDGVSAGGFGFLLMTRAGEGWDVRLYDEQGRPQRKCVFAARRVDCPATKK